MPNEPAEQTTQIETATDAAVDSNSQEEKRFTQADIDRIVQERLARAERRGAPKEKPKAAESSQSADDRLTLKQLSDQIASMKTDHEFERLAIREKLSEKQVARLAPAYRAARSAGGDGWDGAAWVREFVSDFGGGTVNNSNPARPAGATSGPPVSDAGSPAAPATFTEDTPLWQLKPEDRAHLIKTKGHKWYADTLRSQLKGTRVALRRP